MNGKRLYERAATAHKNTYRNVDWGYGAADLSRSLERGSWPVWDFLVAADQKFWNELARAITPKPRKR